MKKLITWIIAPAVLLGVGLLSYTIWSFALTDPNLFLSQSEVFVRFQTYMWHWVLTQPDLLVGWYVSSIMLVFGSYLWLVKGMFKCSQWFNHLGGLKMLLLWAVLILPLLLSSNALSHDVFNYIFNAKMVAVYGANPHVRVALDFSFDNWTRFMHNTHTPAPYWYGWTALSLIPYYMGLGKFTLTWLLFRLFSMTALVLTGVSLSWMLKKDNLRWGKVALLMLNPLVLIETISNSHNDYFMLLPALWAMWLAVEYRLSLGRIIGAVILLAISASSKLATLLLLPILAWAVTIRLSLGTLWRKLASSFGWNSDQTNFTTVKQWVWLITSLTLFLPLFLTRSQQFLPWYLSWPLVFVPLFWWGWPVRQADAGLVRLDRKSAGTILKTQVFNLWPELLLAFSLSSLLRYIPWLWQGLSYSPLILSQQKWLTWGIPVIWIIGRLLLRRFWLQTDQVASV